MLENARKPNPQTVQLVLPEQRNGDGQWLFFYAFKPRAPLF